MARRTLLVSLLTALVPIVAMTVGCSSDPAPGTSADGGTTGDGSTPPNGGDAGACPPAPVLVLEADAHSLGVIGDEVVFMDQMGEPDFTVRKAGTVRKVKLDGSGSTVLVTPAANHTINDVMTFGTTVYYLDSERDPNGNVATGLFAIPVAGGTPSLVGKHVDPTVGLDFDALDAIVHVDADTAYVVRGAATGEGSLWAIRLAGGAETLVYRGSIKSKPMKVGNDFVFATGAIPSGIQNFDTVAKIPAAGGTIGAIASAKCRGDVVAGAYGILCAGSSETTRSDQLSRWDLAGGGHTVIYRTPQSGSAARIGASDGTFVYVMPDVSEGSKAVLSKAPIAGGLVIPVACDREEITRRKTYARSGSNGAYVADLDLVTTATEIVWTEVRKAEGQPRKVAIYRTAR